MRAEPPLVRKGSKLVERKTGHRARVLTTAEGYAMVRFTGAAPVLLHMREISQRFEVVKW